MRRARFETSARLNDACLRCYVHVPGPWPFAAFVRKHRDASVAVFSGGADDEDVGNANDMAVAAQG
jgi:hypothetical protein